MGESESKNNVTIKDVATYANASTSTVSNVINDKGYVSEKKRQDVIDAIRELGYIPTTYARNLALNKTNNIGFILRETHFTRSEPFYTRIFLGTELESKNYDYYVLLATIADNYEKGKDTPRLLKERKVDGFIVAGKVPPPFLEEIIESGLPFVLVDNEYKSYPSINIDNINAGIEAVRYLIENNHSEIAFLGADPEHPSISDRLEGYQLALMKAGYKNTDDLVFIKEDGLPNVQTGYELAKKIDQSRKNPSAVFCANDAMALGVMKYASGKGIRIPDDWAVIGFDDVEGATFSTPKLTTMRVFKEQLGELALRHLAEILIQKSNKNPKFKRSTHMLTVQTELVVRESA